MLAPGGVLLGRQWSLRRTRVVERPSFDLSECVRGILRSSVSGGGTLQREEGDVILLLPALLYEGVELFQEIVPWRHLITVLGDERPKPGGPNISPFGSCASTNPSL